MYTFKFEKFDLTQIDTNPCSTAQSYQVGACVFFISDCPGHNMTFQVVYKGYPACVKNTFPVMVSEIVIEFMYNSWL